MKKVVSACILLGFSTPLYALSDPNITIAAVGTQYNGGTSSMGYIQTATPTSGGCNGLIYFDLANEAGRGMLALAVSARLAGRPLARVDYTGGGNVNCVASLFQL